MRVLRQPALDPVPRERSDRRRLFRSAEFRKADRYDDRQKAALRYTEAIVWDLECGDALWEALYQHYSEPEIVEIGYFVAITMGQQRWLRTLNIDHHQVLVGTDAFMAPGAETPEEWQRMKSAPDYWAKRDHPIAASRKATDAAE